MKTILLAILLSTSVSFANRESGGGTLVKTSQTTGLLDLYLYNREAYLSQEKGSPLAETRSYKRFGIDRLRVDGNPHLQKTLNQIKKWSISSPIMAQYIAESVQNLPIYYTKYRVNIPHQEVYIPESSALSTEDMNIAAYYVGKIGVFINKYQFDHLSEKNQVALLIHEALRHQQISFRSGIDNETLQRLTAEVMQMPRAGMTLDQFVFMKGQVFEMTFGLIETHARAAEALRKACKLVNAGCDKNLEQPHTSAEIIQIADEVRNKLGQILINNPGLENYDEVEKVDASLSSIIANLNGVIMEEIYVKAKNNVFVLNNLFGIGLMDNMLNEYNEKGLKAFHSTSPLQDFINKMKQEGIFQ